jgi:hypothetical protein
VPYKINYNGYRNLDAGRFEAIPPAIIGGFESALPSSPPT